MTEERRVFLINNGGDIPVRELADYDDDEFIIAVWGEAGANIVDIAGSRNLDMKMSKFLAHCTPCGVDWGGLLLSGLKEVAPDIWDAIPDDMGILAFQGICHTMHMIGIHTESDE